MKEKPIRFTQIGVSHSHAAGKAKVMTDSPDVELVGIWEPNAKKRFNAQKQSEYANVKWLEDEEQALQDPTVIAVAIEGDVLENIEFSERAIAAGKHLWLDKPAGVDLDQFQRLLEVAEEHKLLIQLGYMFRYNAGFEFLLSSVQSGLLGDIHSVLGRISITRQQSINTQLKRFPGGPVFEILCHLIDIVVFMQGRPHQVTTILRDHVRELADCINNAAVVFEYPHSLTVLQSTAYEVDHNFRRLEVHGTRGSLALAPFEPPGVKLSLDEARNGFQQGIQDIPVEVRPRYVASLAAFINVIRGKQPADRTPEHELIVQETILRSSDI